jgi:type IV secretory pathway ATPase VirB11/archaellum biosynthesis ATPase
VRALAASIAAVAILAYAAAPRQQPTLLDPMTEAIRYVEERPQPKQQIGHVTMRLEHDEDERDRCAEQLAQRTGTPLTFVDIVAMLDAADHHHGGPCAALAHLEQHGDW